MALMSQHPAEAITTFHPFSPGAWARDDGVRYCVWAPLHGELRVRIRSRRHPERELRLEPQADGYHAVIDENGGTGDRYAYLLEDGSTLPDPASRYQPEGVHGWSEVVDPRAYTWRSIEWRRPGWRGQSIYEIHVGTFTPEGTFRSAIDRFDHLVSLGIEAIQLMPVADFPGTRNWGYDGVALFAPARCYGHPDDLRRLVDAAHQRGLAVILDVVYNHLGPDGNYLSRFADAYFHPDRHTPWGRAFNLDGPDSKPVREFFSSNVAYWLDEFRFDGLRLDATHMIRDESPRHLLAELADVAHERGAFLVAEDERNTTEILTTSEGTGARLDAVWADDFHHQMRVALTGIQEGYFRGYTGTPHDLAQTLEHGWFYSGQPYPAWKGRPRGEDPRHLPSAAFITCIQNHDQVGNRARGERLEHLIGPAAYRAASMLLCLSPYPPLLFMGQEWAAGTPFLFFTDHSGELGEKISEGRQKEFAGAGINQQLAPEDVPDPQDLQTYLRSKLLWDDLRQGPHAQVLDLYRRCLLCRRTWLRGEATRRDAWHVAAVGQSIAIRYDDGEQAQRLVVSCLRGDTRLSLLDQPLLRPPAGYRWRLEFESNPPFSSSGESLRSGSADPWRGSVREQVEMLVVRQPTTVLLVATRVEGAAVR
jgi:maltooligosyltrehalose trehalohydrolase